jgi:hypothetical protein
MGRGMESKPMTITGEIHHLSTDVERTVDLLAEDGVEILVQLTDLLGERTFRP